MTKNLPNVTKNLPNVTKKTYPTVTEAKCPKQTNIDKKKYLNLIYGDGV